MLLVKTESIYNMIDISVDISLGPENERKLIDHIKLCVADFCPDRVKLRLAFEFAEILIY